MPNHFTLTFFLLRRRDVSCSHSNRDLFTCEDNMLFSHVKISCFRAKAHLVLHWYLYNKYRNPLQSSPVFYSIFNLLLETGFWVCYCSSYDIILSHLVKNSIARVFKGTWKEEVGNVPGGGGGALPYIILRCIGLCFNYYHLYLLSRLGSTLDPTYTCRIIVHGCLLGHYSYGFWAVLVWKRV